MVRPAVDRVYAVWQVILRHEARIGWIVYSQLPPEAVKIALVLFLSFLIGLEREEHKAANGAYSFGGVRTFPLIGLIGYSIALVSGTQLLPLAIGFLVIAAFLLMSYWHKLTCAKRLPA
jgi:cell division protein FtsW (lipid II flippase)